MWPVEFWLDGRWAPFFAAGGLFYLVRAHGVTPFRLALLGVSFALAQFYAIQYGPLQGAAAGQSLVPVVVGASIVTAIFVLFWLIAIGRFQIAASPLIYYAGALTYPVYLVHQNLGFMVDERLHQASGLVIGSLLLMLAVVLLVSWCIHPTSNAHSASACAAGSPSRATRTRRPLPSLGACAIG
jgi:peptidoglycan/LPS O-acetylase OafA/YrhL